MKLHDRLTSALFCRQFIKCVGDFIGDILHHINFIARPCSAIVTLLQNYATMRSFTASQTNAEKRFDTNELQLFLYR
jgi:hypothetical protein